MPQTVYFFLCVLVAVREARAAEVHCGSVKTVWQTDQRDASNECAGNQHGTVNTDTPHSNISPYSTDFSNVY